MDDLDLMNAALDGELSEEQQSEFDRRLEYDAQFQSEWKSLQSAMASVTGFRDAPEAAELVAWAELSAGPAPRGGPDLRGGIQRKIKERTRPRYYLQRRPTSVPWLILLSLTMLLLLAIAAWYASAALLGHPG